MKQNQNEKPKTNDERENIMSSLYDSSVSSRKVAHYPGHTKKKKNRTAYYSTIQCSTMKKTGYHIAQCTKATAESTALGEKYISALDDKREATRKRAAEEATVRLRPTYLRRKGDGSGKEAADKAFARMLIATG